MILRERIENYFKLSPEEKDETLVEIVKIYARVNKEHYDNQAYLYDLIQADIDVFTRQEEFEAVQALTDIKNSITMIEQEILNQITGYGM